MFVKRNSRTLSHIKREQYTMNITALRSSFFCAVVIAVFSSVSLRADDTDSDTLRHIYSFWHETEWVKYQAFNYVTVLSTAQGDTAVQASVTRTSKPTSDLDTFVIRIRLWETTHGRFLSSSRYVSIQAGGADRGILKLFLWRGSPHLVYSPLSGVLRIVDVVGGQTVQETRYNEAISSLTTSPSGDYIFLTTGQYGYHLLATATAEHLMDESTSFDITKQTTQFVTTEPVVVKDSYWSTDNTAVLLRFNQVTIVKGGQGGGLPGQLYRAFRLDSKTFANGLFRDPSSGKWNPVAKNFIFYPIHAIENEYGGSASPLRLNKWSKKCRRFPSAASFNVVFRPLVTI